MNLTVNNVGSVGFDEMISWLADVCVEVWVPEDPVRDEDALNELDRLVAYFANMYGYVIALYSQMAYEVVGLEGTDMKKEAMKKRDALWEIARSLRYKHEAASRRITVVISRRGLFEERRNA